MMLSRSALKPMVLPVAGFLFTQHLHAHNGQIGHAYPLGNIVVDGNFSDWPKNAVRYPLGTHLSDNPPKNSADFNGFFQVGYRLDNYSLYLAITITDDNFIEDTSENVSWNTQDGLELFIDARHLPSASGVTAFMFSKKLRNINRAMFDPFAKNASWDMMEVSFIHRGNTRYYEWRIQMGDELRPGKSVGLDLMYFDKDPDGSFTFSGWGKGGSKFRDPKSLSDIILLPAQEKLAVISG